MKADKRVQTTGTYSIGIGLNGEFRPPEDETAVIL